MLKPKFKQQVAISLLPFAQLVIRHTPPGNLRRRVWKWAKWREHNYTSRTSFGTRMHGNTLDLIQGYIYYFGVWEPNLSHFLIGRLRGQSNRTFVDVGANVGYFSLLAARCMGTGSAVIAIEAFPSIYSKLVRNITLNKFKNVRPIQVAASVERGEIELFHAGGLNEGGTTSIPGKFATTPVLVRTAPLAELLSPQELQSLKLMKIDVEGAEASVLAGLESKMALLAHDAEVVVEISPASRDKTEFIFRLFSQNGFFPYSLHNSYAPEAYLFPARIARPKRLLDLPTEQTDVVFSRLNCGEL